eukprot:COSAG01_NODE_4839_length_4694_cov_16.413058_7_plen_145_part_00
MAPPGKMAQFSLCVLMLVTRLTKLTSKLSSKLIGAGCYPDQYSTSRKSPCLHSGFSIQRKISIHIPVLNTEALDSSHPHITISPQSIKHKHVRIDRLDEYHVRRKLTKTTAKPIVKAAVTRTASCIFSQLCVTIAYCRIALGCL